jgi:hypothetical protein
MVSSCLENDLRGCHILYEPCKCTEVASSPLLTNRTTVSRSFSYGKLAYAYLHCVHGGHTILKVGPGETPS